MLFQLSDSDSKRTLELATRLLASENSGSPDVAPASVPFAIAGVLILLVVIISGWGWLSSKLNISATSTAVAQDDLDIWTPHGTPSTIILVLACMIPSLLVLGGIQGNFNSTMLVITIFPISLILGVSMKTFYVFKSLRKQYYRLKRTGDINGLAYFEACLRKFEVHSLFADPDEPLTRVVLVGTSQILLFSMYVWGLWDRGRPDFNNARLYAYYYAGMFVLVAYIAGKLAGDMDINLKRFAHLWRRSIQAGGRPAKREIINRPSGLFSSPMFWAFYFLGVELYEDDYSWASEGEITTATLILRCFLDTIVNTAGLFYIMVGLPIQVCHSASPVDFVLTAVAAFYILEIDNSGDLRTVEIPNFENERRSMHAKLDSDACSDNDELLAIVRELPDSTRERLVDLLKPKRK